MKPEDLLKEWPHMDFLMAETLIKLHEAGKLRKMAESWPELEQKNIETNKEDGKGKSE